MEYPKTENLFNRDPETHKTPAALGLRSPAVGQIARWLVTEKIDGMNMRVVWTPDDDTTPAIYGRTDRAQIPGDLLTIMRDTFTYEKMMAAFSVYELDTGPLGDDTETWVHRRPSRVVLFGEGFGAGIQSGGHYGPTKQFRLFDVVVGETWLQWADVCDVARKLGIETVPVLETAADVEEVVDMVVNAGDPAWPWLTATPEGVVARTDPYLFDGRGHRVMFKAKVKDLA